MASFRSGLIDTHDSILEDGTVLGFGFFEGLFGALPFSNVLHDSFEIGRSTVRIKDLADCQFSYHNGPVLAEIGLLGVVPLVMLQGRMKLVIVPGIGVNLSSGVCDGRQHLFR
ncbi:MAG: hypothetical protein A4E62_00936 [Syntrophorhabdus sp. PtaU1.Bin002]|nr:MAG: hypothetical protein A4E62_00936 [Syntrophorhabdus sp. PtaU1.Bin002]